MTFLNRDLTRKSALLHVMDKKALPRIWKSIVLACLPMRFGRCACIMHERWEIRSVAGEASSDVLSTTRLWQLSRFSLLVGR